MCVTFGFSYHFDPIIYSEYYCCTTIIIVVVIDTIFYSKFELTKLQMHEIFIQLLQQISQTDNVMMTAINLKYNVT